MESNATLHIVSASPFSGTALADCLRLLQDQDSVLLIENGVWSINGIQQWQRQLEGVSAQHRVYVLAEDAALRGIHVLPPFELIDYERMVVITCEHVRSISWF